jgi:chromosome segregation ATPase
MNTRINESFKQKAHIAELESKVFEMNNLRAQLDEAREIIAQNGSFKSAQTDSELEEIIAAQQETIDSFSRQIFELKKANAGQPTTTFESPFKNFEEAAQNITQQGFIVDYDAQIEAAVDAVRQEEEKLRDEYEIIMVRQQETLDQYAENLLKAERENAEKDELLKDLHQRVNDFEEAYAAQQDLIAGLQMEVDLYKEQESAQISENDDDTQSLTIMIQEISEQKQRAEFERNEIAEELLKTRQMFALAQQQIQDLQKIEDEYARMQSEHSELRQRVDELQNSQKKNGDVSEAIQTLEAKIEELQSRFKNVETVSAPPEFLKNNNGVNGQENLPENIPFKKPETEQPEVKPEREEKELPQPEITETEPEEPFKKQPETKTPDVRPKRALKEKPAANPAKDAVIDRMAALLERLEKSIV